MKPLIVNIEIDGRMTRVGTISGDSPSDARFAYSPEYCAGLTSAALSLSLPLRESPFSSQQTATFFEGLLPEGFTRRSLSQRLHIDEDNYLALLHDLGRECLGAICVLEEGECVSASYEPISAEQVRDLAAEGTTQSVEMVAKAHLSLTGASGKVGLYRSHDDKWYLPEGSAPSTHIVKQSHVRLDGIVTNEQLALMTARRCGLSIPAYSTSRR